MGRFVAKNTEEFDRALEGIKRRNAELLKGVSSDIGKALLPAGQVIEARAKEILTENGHIVTGNLRRSINTQARVRKLGPLTHGWQIEVGTFADYAVYVEALEDGGYLAPAAEQRRELSIRILQEQGVRPSVEKWGAA